MLDLFGEVPVTIAEVVAWCEVVPRISSSSWRFAWYVASWNVADKIRQAKLAGELDQILADRAPPAPGYDELAGEIRRRELELRPWRRR